MNPYEAPQSSLEPEERPRVQVKYEHYDRPEVVRMVLVIVLALSEFVLGILLLHRLAVALGFYTDANVAGLDELLPYLAACFLVFGWILWWLRKLSD